MDKSENNSLSKDEFIDGLKAFGFNQGNTSDTISTDTLNQAFHELDKDKSGEIIIDEFLELIRLPLNDSRKKLVDKAFMCLSQNGKDITVKDLKKHYNVREHPKYKNGEMTEEQVLTKFLNNFEADYGNNDGTVTIDEFRDYYSAISATIDHEGYFELMMRQAWKGQETCAMRSLA